MSYSQIEFVLVPTRRDVLTKVLRVTMADWRAALALCRKHGYSPPEVGAMTRDVVRWFRRSLSAALNTITEPAAREPFERLVRFCEADGATGFTLEKRWKRAI